ncbi:MULTISPECIES: hypothetical protein [unclassified Pseudomonas]|uniref:hypothetical protein n=1 Tax=unclassified Pseudomonas TaxID=196821 RepID=UPI000C2F9463|nr:MULTISPECIES: hypothetical protein [unclassified Pseudomonas]MCU1736132.1 hypothetical protein [Pseudomonas sp. 20S_6.2_Bac1]
MKKKLLAGLFLGMGMAACSLNAAASDNLFKSYAYGTPMADYKTADGYYDCSAEIGATALCLDNVDFIEHKFMAALVFSGAKLIMVSLVSPFDQDLYASAAGTLGKTFKLSALSDGKSQLDVIQLAATSPSREVFASKLQNYESGGLSGGTLSYTFIEGVDRDKKFTDIAAQLAALPDNVRSAELMLTGEGSDSALIIRFGFPKLEANKVAEAAKKPAESF